MRLRHVIGILLAVLPGILAGCRDAAESFSTGESGRIDAAVSKEIADGNFPGAVILVGQERKILYRRAFGDKLITPHKEAMDAETVFDIASLSKPVATAMSIMILRDRGKIRLSDYARQYLPAFACEGKEETRIKHLLTHTSGLPAYTSASVLKQQSGSPCPEAVIEKICSLKALTEPGKDFRYSCLGYITSGKIVEVVSGKKLDEFAAENIFSPLKMSRTTYNPTASLAQSIAATEVVDGRPLRGTVHDPLAQLMDGISGNAGVFTTADDLSVFCRMLLNGGKWNGVRILSPESAGLLTTVMSHGRACGFDVKSSYSWIKGSYAPEGTFCHSGYTGTSIVCDPASGIYIIILTNRVHPEDKGSVRSIRTKVADIVFGVLG